VKLKLILSAALAITTVTAAPAAFAKSNKATCLVTTGTTGGQKYATLKCAPATSPGNYFIRSTVWERSDKDGYRSLAKYSGRKFSCTLTKASSEETNMELRENYQLSDC
jgi:hypothetical protein